MINQTLYNYLTTGRTSFDKYMAKKKIAAATKYSNKRNLQKSLKTIIPFNNYKPINYINNTFNLE